MIRGCVLGAAVTTGVLAATAAGEGGVSAADEVRAIVAEMMADAGSRSSLLDAGGRVTAGPGGFVIASDDEAFRLRVGGYTQFRYLANFRDDEGGTVDDFQSGFTIQRSRLVFSGRAHDRVDFLLLPFAGPNGNWSIIDAWARFEIDERWKLRVGQFKLPFLREWLISERFNFAVERSELTAVYASIYSQGVQLEYQDDSLRVHASFSDGIRAFNSDFVSPAEADYACTARADLLLDGTWGMFADNTALGETEDGLLLG
ncbi:MAG: porin, partial [Planctomycetota bacterium]